MQLVSVDKDARWPSSDRAKPQMAGKDVIVRYLADAPKILAIRSFVLDEIEPERRHPVSVTFSSDGKWVWSGLTAYYVKQYDVKLPDLFVQWILEARTPPASLPPEVRQEAVSLARAPGRSGS
jgi:hypothetical protein